MSTVSREAQFYERLIQAVTAHAHLIYGTSSLYLWMDSLGERKKRRVKGKDDRERKGERLTKGQIETYRYTKKRREKDTQIKMQKKKKRERECKSTERMRSN